MQLKGLTILLLAIVYVTPNRCKLLGNSSDTNIEEEVTLSAPKFMSPSQYKMVTVIIGSSTEMKCIAQGNPVPNITWYKNQETLIPRPNFTSSEFDLSDLKWKLFLYNLTKEDDGNYTCIICNQLGCINNSRFLSVRESFGPSKPVIREGYPGNVTALLNTTVTLTCPTTNNLVPQMFVMHPIHNMWIGPSRYFVDENKIKSSPFNSVRRIIESQNPKDQPDQLTLFDVTKEDEGWYVCVAMNTFGIATQQGYLRILESQHSSEEFETVRRIPVSFLTIVIFVSGGLLIVGVIVIVTTCSKLKKEVKHKQLALEMAREVIETYWSKKVTIDKPHINTSSQAAGVLVLPTIKIEKQKVSEVKKNPSDSKMLPEYELPLDKDWEIPRETVVLGKLLGEGEFGKVVEANCVGVLKRGPSTVAVKMLKNGHTDAEMISLISEMEIMKVVGKHVNIINLLGCCTQGGPLYVIVEFAPYDNLRNFLRKYRPGMRTDPPSDGLEDGRNLTSRDLVSFAYQVSKGMEYLASRHCIHRDLAARNVLVSENLILKIADFGLARNIETDYYYRKKTSGKLPVRWMAPESLNSMLFTVKTDVWSFGILLWEIMTQGATPYRTIPGQYLFQHIGAGHRLEKPTGCSLDLYLLMRECWSFSPQGRPSFTLLVKELDRILTEMTDVEYLVLTSPEPETSPVTETLWLSRNISPENKTQPLLSDG